MCMEDVRMGREMQSATTHVSAPDATSVPLVGASKYRTHLAIYHDLGTGVVCPSDIDMAANGGIFVTTGNAPIEIDIQTHGPVVTEAWSIRGEGATLHVIVIESFLRKD